MEGNGVSMFGGTIHVDGIHQSLMDDDLEKEEDKERELELKNALHNAFDDLIMEEESYEEQSSLYYGNQSLKSNAENSNNSPNQNGTLTNYEERRQPAEHQGYNDGQETPLVWSDDSDTSGNFVGPDSVIKSPTHFHLDMNNVVSHSDDSISKEQPNYSYSEYQTRLPEDQNCYENKPSYSAEDEKFLSAETPYEQLQLLYEARGREIDRVTEEFNKLKFLSGQEMSSLKHQINLLKGDKETLQISQEQMKILLSENESRIRSLTTDLKEKESHLVDFEVENKKLKLQVSTAEGTISNLECQVSELQSVDSIAKSHQMHENFLRNLQSCHTDEVDELKRKLKSAQGRATEFEHQIKNLEEDLITIRKSKDLVLEEKSKVINQLSLSLETAQQQVKVLLSNKSQDQSCIRDSDKMENVELRKKLSSMETQLQQSRKDLETYDMLMKLGLFKSIHELPEDSIDQLKLGTALTFDDTGLHPSSKHNSRDKCSPDPNISEKMKQELLKSLYSNKKYREEIDRLNENISQKQKNIKILESEFKSVKESQKQNKSQTGSEENMKTNLLVEENSILKKEMTAFVGNLEAIKNKGEEMLNVIQEFASNGRRFSKSHEETTAMQETIKNYSTVLDNFSKTCTYTWEDLRKENLQLYSKRYLSIQNFDNMIDSLKELRNDLRIKDVPNSSDFLTLKQLLDSFTFSVKELKAEALQYVEDSTKIRNELWNYRLNLERTKNENLALKTKHQTLEDLITKTEKEKLETVENCKETYLRFHKETICKLRDDLQKEYNVIIASLKEEVERISMELMDARNNYIAVCQEKNNLEEVCKKDKIIERKNSLYNKENLIKENLISENESLKEELDDMKRKLLTSEEEFKIQLKNVQVVKENHKWNDSSSIEENVELMEAREKITQLVDEIQRISYDSEQLKMRQCEEINLIRTELESVKKQNNDNLTGSTYKEINSSEFKEADVSFSHLINTVDKYRQLNEELKEEREKLKIYYENQITNMNKQIEVCSNNAQRIVEETKSICEQKYNLENKILEDKLKNSLAMVNRLKEDKLNLMTSHEEVVSKLTDEVQNQESTNKEMRQKWEMALHELMNKMHELNFEKVKFEKEALNLKQIDDIQKQKYSKLKDKFFRLKNNFDKYKTWSEERVEHLVQDSQRISKENAEDNQRQFDNFRNWLVNSRSILSDGVSQVIKNLKCIPERALPQSAVEPHIKALLEIHKGLMKLDIRDKISSTQTLNK